MRHIAAIVLRCKRSVLTDYAGSSPAAPIMRTCRLCREEKSEDDFYYTYHYPRYVCKKCENRKRTIWRIEQARAFKLKAIQYLGGKCRRCGYHKSKYALEFNHLDPKKKKYEPTRLFHEGICWERVKEEIDKCELLCSNCHKEVTFGVE